MDSYWTFNCQGGYELIYCKNTVASDHISHSEDTSFSSYCLNLKGCSHCIGCVGLTNIQYAIGNKELSKETYEREKKSMTLSDMRDTLEKTQGSADSGYPYNTSIEDSTGHNLSSCKNCIDCAYVEGGENCSRVRIG